MKKIAIIGKGTAGVLVASDCYKRLPNVKIDWYYDPTVPSQSVGEGSTFELPKYLYDNVNFNHFELDRLDGTAKYGILKEGWGQQGTKFVHNFVPPGIGYHFNAVKLQNYLMDYLKGKVNIIEQGVTADDVDANYVIDCSGKPKSYDDYYTSEFIPVNSVHVNQCFWDYPRFFYTGTIARPYGWVFLIPLQNRCSVGYLYNKNINSLDEVKEDILKVIEQYGLTPSSTTNDLSFNTYYHKTNFGERVFRNGNASFFLEPLEATSISFMYYIQKYSLRAVFGTATSTEANTAYLKAIRSIEHIIMMHYFSGSVFKTAFWDFAEERGARCMERAAKDPDFVKIIKSASFKQGTGELTPLKGNPTEYGPWWEGSFVENIIGLGIKDKLAKALNL